MCGHKAELSTIRHMITMTIFSKKADIQKPLAKDELSVRVYKCIHAISHIVR